MKADEWSGKSIVKWTIKFRCPACQQQYNMVIEQDDNYLGQLDITCDCTHQFKVTQS